MSVLLVYGGAILGIRIAHQDIPQDVACIPVTDIINPASDLQCDGPVLRLWLYDHFPDIKFEYRWGTWVSEAMCKFKCNPENETDE